MMLDISRRLLYYKQRHVQKAIADASSDREVGIRYGTRGFGKRPDVLIYENDVMGPVKKGATSFHVSEERWEDPLKLTTEMRKQDLDELRSGWDLVLDIDCPYWHFSKLTTHLFIKALKMHGIKSISCKFSGNKGFHIGVPFESFPDNINEMPVKNWFPDGPKRIALYLLDYIANNLITVKKTGEIIFDNIYTTTIEEICSITNKSHEELSKTLCTNCRKEIKKKTLLSKKEFICSRCGRAAVKEDSTASMVCPRCGILMEKIEHESSLCSCGSNDFKEIFDPLSIVDVDTILISSRHMYRAPYSMHEKSGLVSIPVSPDIIMGFEKNQAEPEKVFESNMPMFLDSSVAEKDEAMRLMIAAFDYTHKLKEEPEKKDGLQRTYEEITAQIPEELFPPCIQEILKGLEDGRKRAMFVLTNFLTSAGWPHDRAEELLLEWNRKNKEPLREAMIRNQIRYHRQKKKKILPPNCRSYYQDFGVCHPDNLCERIKNPVQYSKRRAFVLNNKSSKGRARLTDEQKEMRRQYREKIKKEKRMTNKDEA
ncbi:hypothetical protein JXC34_06085 [Candidatus Woesearchaeota archaeon]|nr:hypothetical protein [Candidatus Woesearchaeota archaeon]